MYSYRTPTSYRALGVEHLEPRHLFSVLRIGAWNTANNPNTDVNESQYATIFDAIGKQTVQGNTRRLDVLSLSETDPVSIARLESVLESLYPASDYQSLITSLDGGGDATGFLYDSSSVEMLNSIEIDDATLTHHSMRAQFRPTGTAGEADLYAYSLHLKSGNTASDELQRGAEAALLRGDADSLGEGANVLFLGDFNWHSSSELAYVNFAAAGTAASDDVADSLGNWTGNSAFMNLHSHSALTTRSRFDMHLASHELKDSVGIDYIDGSYVVFGNNGTHGVGNPITSGTGASTSTLAALTEASDHLPVLADYEIIVSQPSVRVTESSGDTRVIEGKLFDTYSVVLDTVPAADVTVTVTPDAQFDVGAGPAAAVELVFSPANAFTPQTILVSAFDDSLNEGTHAGSVGHSAASLDPDYQGLPVGSVAITVIDDDAPTILINEIDSNQTGSDSQEFVELYDGGVGNVALDGHVLVLFNGADDSSYRSFDLDGFATDSNGLFVIGNPAVNGVDRTFGNGSLQNGADAAALYLANASDFTNDTPVTNTNLLDAVVYGTNDADDVGLLSLLLAGEPQVDEDADGMDNTQSLGRVPDFGEPRVTTSYTTALPTPGNLNDPPPPGVVIVQSAGRTDIEEGGATDSYSVVLETFPTEDVTVTVQPDSQVDLGAGPGSSIALVFSPENGLVPQTVFVVATNDDSPEQEHIGIVSHRVTSLDADYAGLLVPRVVANISDDDLRSIVINEIDSDTAGVDELEFVELFDGGVGNTSLDGLVLVFFNGRDDQQYAAFDLNDQVTGPDGFFVLGNQAVPNVDLVFRNNGLQNGADAVALYDGEASQFLVPTTESLVDAVVYDTRDADDVSLLTLLPAGEAQINEGEGFPSSEGAIARAVDGGAPFDTSRYRIQIPTPGTRNVPLPTGDYDRDYNVDNDDYLAWVADFGSTVDLRADGNGNGIVDAADFVIWRDSFESFTLTAAASVRVVSQPASTNSTSYSQVLPKRPRMIHQLDTSRETSNEESSQSPPVTETTKWQSPRSARKFRAVDRYFSRHRSVPRPKRLCSLARHAKSIDSLFALESDDGFRGGFREK